MRAARHAILRAFPAAETQPELCPPTRTSTVNPGPGGGVVRSSFFQIHRLMPSALLQADGTDEAVFERVWARLDIGPDAWRGHCFLEDEGGLFLKGLNVPMRCSPKMWRRRWDITREARKLARAAAVSIEVPEIVGWGEEKRAGIARRSFLLLKRIHDSVPFNEIANDETGELAATVGEDRMGVFREVGRLIRCIHAAGMRHGDLASRNILLTRESDGPKSMPIDIPRARWPVTSWRRNVLRRIDLYRITKSAMKEGASKEEARALLDRAAGDEAAEVMAKTLLIKAINRRLKRKARSYFWRWTGA